MHRPQKRDSSKRLKTKQMSNQEEIEELTKCVAEDLNAKSQEIEEPFEHYAHQLRMRWHQDINTFCNRCMLGYEALLEQLRSKRLS